MCSFREVYLCVERTYVCFYQYKQHFAGVI